jgi:hypothetical protein
MSIGFHDNPDQPAVELGPAEIEIIALPGSITLHLSWPVYDGVDQHVTDWAREALRLLDERGL